MRYFLFIAFIMPFCSFAQQKIGIDTTILVGNENMIYSYRQIIIDQNNNKYVMGYFKGSITIQNNTIYTTSSCTYSNSKAIFLAKYDSLNNFLWVKKISECDTIGIFSLKLNKKNEPTIGISYQGLIYFENDSSLSKGGSDIILLNYDTIGIIKNTIKIGEENGEFISLNSIDYDSNNNLYVSGGFNYTWTNNSPNYKLIFGTDTLVSNNQKAFIVKYDTLGNPIWAKSYGGNGQDGIACLISYNNNIYITASFFQAGPTNDIGGINVSFPLNYTSKYILAKLDNNGNGVWVKRFGNNDPITATLNSNCLTVKNNRVYINGHSFSNNQNVFLFDGGPTLTGTDQVDYFIAAYDTNGNFKWNTISNSAGSEYLTQLHADSNGNVVGVGKINYTIKFPTDRLYSNGGDDVMVCSYDSMGAFRWAIRGGGTSADIGSGIAADTDGKLYIVGGTTSTECYMGNDTLYPTSGQSTLFFSSIDSIARLTPLSTTDVNQQEINSFTLYPNPVANYVTLSYKKPLNEVSTISIYNTLGQAIYSTSLDKNKLHYILDVSSFANGIYSIQCKSHQNIFTKIIVVQH